MHKVPKDTRLFFSMRRSGSHGVIDWILGHHEGYKFYNNIDENLNTPQVMCSGDESFTLASLEDFYPSFRFSNFENYNNILLIRDPYNLFASRFKFVRKFISNPADTFTCLDLISMRSLDVWKSYARAYLEGEGTFINFNNWYTDPDYRQELSSRLGWEHNDSGFGSKQGHAYSGGSSFEKPDVLNSWKHFEKDEEYLAFFDKETIMLASEIFGPPPGRSQWSRIKLNDDVSYRTTIEELVNNIKNNLDKNPFHLIEMGLRVFPNNSRLLQLRELIIRFTNDENRSSQ